MRTKNLLFFLTMTSGLANAAYPINTTDDLVKCMRNHIINWVVAPSIPTWEQQPTYEPIGRYFSSSWNDDARSRYGITSMLVGDSNVVSCDLNKNEDGTPDTSKPGYCIPTIENGEVTYTYKRIDESGTAVTKEMKFAKVVDSKLFCLNFARP